MEMVQRIQCVDTGAQRINPIPTATSESSFRVIGMSSLAYPYSKCDFEHDAINPVSQCFHQVLFLTLLTCDNMSSFRLTQTFVKPGLKGSYAPDMYPSHSILATIHHLNYWSTQGSQYSQQINSRPNLEVMVQIY